MAAPIECCIVGYGRMAQIHATNLRAHTQARLSYVCGVGQSANGAQKGRDFAAAFGAKYTERLEDALADPAVRAVIVATPTSSHAEVIGKAIQAGKSVLVEKPVTLSTAETERMFAEAKAKGAVLMAGFHRRFDPNFVSLKAKIADVGGVDMVKITSRDPAGKNDETLRAAAIAADQTKAALFDSLIHDFDMAVWLMGEAPADVYAVQTLPQTISVYLRFPTSGALCVINWAKNIEYGYDQRVEIQGPKGMLQADNVLQTSVKLTQPHPAPAIEAAPHPFFPERYREAYRGELQHFIDAILGVAPLSVTAEQCGWTSRIADRALESILRSNAAAFERTAAPTKVPDGHFAGSASSTAAAAHGTNGTAAATSAKRGVLAVALIGAGRIGGIRAELLATNQRTKLVCVCDVDAARAKEIADRWGVKHYGKLEEALADAEVQAVWISVPTHLHFDVIKAAAAAKKPIYSEKPIALQLEEIDESYRIAKAAGVPLLCGWNRRFDPHFSSLQRMMQAGDIGRPDVVTLNNGDNPLPPVEIARQLGSLYHDFMVHDIDCALWLVGEFPTSLYAAGATLVPGLKGSDVLDTGVLVLTFASGTTVLACGRRAAVHGYDQRVEVLGRRGRMLKAENRPATTVERYIDTGKGTDCMNYSFPDRYRDAYNAEVTHFAEVVLDGAPAVVTHEQCRQVHLLSDAALRSQQTGKAIIFE